MKMRKKGVIQFKMTKVIKKKVKPKKSIFSMALSIRSNLKSKKNTDSWCLKH